MKQILIAGGSGLIGSALAEHLRDKGHNVFILTRSAGSKINTFSWDPSTRYIQDNALEGIDVIINLAGASVAGSRWTQSFKDKILNSRLESTKTLVEEAERMDADIHLINASAIGFYPNSAEPVDETTPPGNAFLSEVCKQWEAAAQEYKGAVSIVRIGLVLSQNGGFLSETAKPIRYGIGAPLGSGNQMQSWIHIQDLVSIFSHIVDNRSEGIFNAVALEPVSNKKMTQAIAGKLNRPLILPPVPKFALKLLFGDFTEELLGDHLVSCQKIMDEGFEFQYKKLDQALGDLLG